MKLRSQQYILLQTHFNMIHFSKTETIKSTFIMCIHFSSSGSSVSGSLQALVRDLKGIYWSHVKALGKKLCLNVLFKEFISVVNLKLFVRKDKTAVFLKPNLTLGFMMAVQTAFHYTFLEETLDF